MPASHRHQNKTILERQGYGKPWDELTEAERTRQRGDHIYATSHREWMETDMPGRRNPENLVNAGPHEAVPGRPHEEDRVPDDSLDRD